MSVSNIILCLGIIACLAMAIYCYVKKPQGHLAPATKIRREVATNKPDSWGAMGIQAIPTRQEGQAFQLKTITDIEISDWWLMGKKTRDPVEVCIWQTNSRFVNDLDNHAPSQSAINVP